MTTADKTPPLEPETAQPQNWLLTLACGHVTGGQAVPRQMECPRCGVPRQVRFAIAAAETA